MRVVISLQGKYSAIALSEDAVVAYKRYFGQEAKITLDEFLETLERDGKIIMEGEKSGRKVTITKVRMLSSS